MKHEIIQLALKVGDVEVAAPNSIKRVNDQVSPLGGNLFQLAITLLLMTVSLLSLFFLIWGGIKWILSGGDKHGIESAKATITYAVIGLIVSFSAFLILNVIGGIFGIDFMALFGSE